MSVLMCVVCVRYLDSASKNNLEQDLPSRQRNTKKRAIRNHTAFTVVRVTVFEVCVLAVTPPLKNIQTDSYSSLHFPLLRPLSNWLRPPGCPVQLLSNSKRRL